MYSSLLLFPVKLEGKKIIVLDETLLPFKEGYIKVDSLEKALDVLGSMKTRAFGQVLLFFYCCALFDSYSIAEITQRFKETRPTFDFELLAALLEREVSGSKDILESVNKFIANFDFLRRRRMSRLAALLPNPAKVLTICNINGELIYLYEELKKLSKECIFYVSETRPYLQGTRLTFWELRKNNIPAYLICDNQAASVMKDGKVNCVVTGADRATTKGDIINKVGTYALARLAKYFGIPFYTLVQYPKDIDVSSIVIEERPSSEVFMFLEEGSAGIDAVYPSFDIVTSNLVTKQINILGQ